MFKDFPLIATPLNFILLFLCLIYIYSPAVWDTLKR